MDATQKISELEWEVEGLLDFIENASIPLHSVNGSGIIIWANKSELDFLGYTKEEYVGKHISHFHADQSVIGDILSRLISKETLRDYPARLKCKNGEIKPVLINSNVLWKDDKFIHTRCFTRDASDIRKSEIQKVDALVTLQSENKLLKQEISLLKKELKALRKDGIRAVPGL